MPRATASVTSLTTVSTEPSSSARSAAGIAGPRSRPAGFNPVNGAPSPARCMRTSVSKKWRSASSRACGPSLRTDMAWSKACVISASSSARTHGSTRFTLPVSIAFFASITTGPSTPSQWPTAHTSNNPVSPIPGDCAKKPATGSFNPRNWANDFPATYKIAASTAAAAQDLNRFRVFMASAFE